MAETTTVVRPTAAARPYARAAYEDAQAAQALPAWSVLLQAAATVVADSTLYRLLGPRNPRLRAQEKAELLAGLCRDVVSDTEPPEGFSAFIRLLADNQRLHLLPSIAVLYERLRAQADNILRAELVSAITVTPAQRAQVVKALEAKFQRSVELDCTMDKTLIAGAIIRVGDLVIDGSARGRLDKLAMALSQ